MSDDIYNDILWKLRIPLPYELRGLTVQDLMDERKRAADEIELLRGLIDNINHVIHTKEPVNPWMHDRVIVQQTKRWPKLWAAIQKACTQYRKGNDNG